MAMKGNSALGGILAFLALHKCLCIRPKVGREDKVIGWSEKYKDPDGTPSLHIEHLSWSPRAFLYGSFLSEDECDHLIKMAKPHMKDATVIDQKTGEKIPNSMRQNKEAYLGIGQDEVVNKIEFRIARYTFLPGYNGEPLHIMYTTPGHGHVPHTDWLEDWWHPNLGNERVATVIMYLNDVAEGGETVFPNSTSQPHKGDPVYSTCAQKGLSVKPKKGDALMFYNLLENGRTDGTSLHQGCPVIRGDKWTATKRILVNRRPLDNTIAAFKKTIPNNIRPLDNTIAAFKKTIINNMLADGVRPGSKAPDGH